MDAEELRGESAEGETMDINYIFQVAETLEEDVERLYAEVNWRWNPRQGQKMDDRFTYEMLSAGRLEEMRRIHRYKVYTEINEVDWTGEVVDCRWVDDLREGDEGPWVRSRIVGREYALEFLYGLFAGTPDTFLFWYFLSCLAEDPEMVALIVDATSAFLQSELKDPIAVYPPHGLRKPGKI